MNEAETRAEHIDPALAAAGWGVVEGSRIRREYSIAAGRIEGHGRRGKALTADYVLEYRNTKLAVWPTRCRRSPARIAPRRRRWRLARTSTASSRCSSTSSSRTT